jgi:hypothetical protein
MIMNILKWVKANLLDWSAKPSARRSLPPDSPPGYKRIKRAKVQARKSAL